MTEVMSGTFTAAHDAAMEAREQAEATKDTRLRCAVLIAHALLAIAVEIRRLRRPHVEFIGVHPHDRGGKR